MKRCEICGSKTSIDTKVKDKKFCNPMTENGREGLVQVCKKCMDLWTVGDESGLFQRIKSKLENNK